MSSSLSGTAQHRIHYCCSTDTFQLHYALHILIIGHQSIDRQPTNGKDDEDEKGLADWTGVVFDVGIWRMGNKSILAQNISAQGKIPRHLVLIR